jgi:YHYH protein
VCEDGAMRSLLLVFACSAGNSTNDLGSAADLAVPACALTARTAPTSTITNGCALLTRDASSCSTERTMQGLSGAWLAFSCRVTLINMGSWVQATADSRPDYASNYFAKTDACWTDYTPSFPDPNLITAQNLSLQIPLTPNTTPATMGLGAVGVAVNGVEIFDNQAAPGDDIFLEAGSFDRCGGHPAPGGAYHYHGEPFAISSDDSNLVGVLRDGYFVYGRRDGDGSLPVLDANGGHLAPPPGETAARYHYHLNKQTSNNPGTGGQVQWFLTTGTYEGTPM